MSKKISDLDMYRKRLRTWLREERKCVLEQLKDFCTGLNGYYGLKGELYAFEEALALMEDADLYVNENSTEH